MKIGFAVQAMLEPENIINEKRTTTIIHVFVVAEYL
jgi:hypothetical protein